ncbi:MAG TPA: SDR family NAD(P)-dependent oxidoreductase [Spirochaetia bacterium]|nr:SDR family NAD(P)-dependent oxidoreductase [Spirochaetia bacterium]
MNPHGKTALVTGSTDGVGRWVASKLAALGATVLVHGRNRERGERVVADILNAGGNAAFYAADFASLAQVRMLAATLQRDFRSLDVLINNAGIGGAASSRETNQDGYELRFAVNYLSGFLLTRLLLPMLVRGAPARIVNVASVGQKAIDFNDVMLTRGYDAYRAYCQSKLAQIMFTFDLAEELAGEDVTANCLHPATFMDTTMVREAGVTPTSSVEDGGKSILNLATSQDGKTGGYYDRTRSSRANRQAYDRQARQRLRDLSYSLTKLENPSLSQGVSSI